MIYIYIHILICILYFMLTIIIRLKLCLYIYIYVFKHDVFGQMYHFVLKNFGVVKGSPTSHVCCHVPHFGVMINPPGLDADLQEEVETVR